MFETIRNPRDDSGRLLAAAWLAVLLLATAGCGGGGEEAPAGDTAGQPPAPEVEPSPYTDEELERVVAEVNGKPIRLRKVEEVAEVNRVQIEARGTSLDEAGRKEVRRTALQLIIGSELMHQDALAQGMTPDSDQVEQQMENARKRFESEKDYHAYLERGGLTEEEIRAEVEYKLLVQEYIQSLTDKLKVNEELVRKAYEANKEQFQEGEQVRAAYILVKCEEDAPDTVRADARARVEAAYERLQQGDEFAQVAREYSQAPNAAKGGDVGFFKRGDMVPLFEEIAFGLETGGVSEIFETQFGFNILTVLDRREARPLPFEEVKPTLMLLMAQQQESATVQGKMAELYQAAEVTILDEELKPVATEDTAGGSPEGTPAQG